MTKKETNINFKKKSTKVKDEIEPPVLQGELLVAVDEIKNTGIDEKNAQELVLNSAKALKKTSAHLAVFPLKSWEKNLSNLNKAFYEGWTKDPKWGTLRSIIIKRIGLISLSKSSLETPWALHSTKKLIELENEVIRLAKRETNEHHIPQKLLDNAFSSRPTMAEEQKIAAIACSSGNKAVIVTEGTAGAGKSFTLGAIREIYENIPGRTSSEPKGYNIIGTALSWTATKVLEASAGLSGGKAIQGLVMEMDAAKEKGEEFFKRRTLLIVDEAGLVGIEHMHKLLSHAANSKEPVRVILTGDSLQLNPVMAGNALEAIVDHCGSARLDTIRRQKQDSHRRAVKHFCFGRAENGLWTYWQQEAVHFCPNNDLRREKVMRDYVRYIISNPEKNALVLALENKEVKTLNEEIRKRLKQVGRLVGKEYSIKVTDAGGSFYANFSAGDQIVLRKNNIKHPIFKSKFSTIIDGIKEAELTSKIKRNKEKSTPVIQKFFSKIIKACGFDNQSETLNSTEIEKTGIFNRMAGIILNIKEHPEKKEHYIIRILFAEGGEADIDTSVYRDEDHDAVPINHNFATTIYASQGQTVNRVFMIDSPYMNRRLAYVGMSRHTELCDIYLDCQEIQDRMDWENKNRTQSTQKTIEQITSSEINTATQKKLDKLNHELSEWQPKYENTLKPSDYLRIVAKSWNADSQNPTPGIAQKHMNEAREIIKKMGKEAWKPAKHNEDNPDDNHLTGKTEDDPKLRHTEPYFFEDLEKLHIDLNKNENDLDIFDVQKINTITFSDKREKTELPTWANDKFIEASLNSLEGQIWNINRYGYYRLFSIDPVAGYPTCRWAFDGALKAGDGQTPVLSNYQHFKEAPWMMVQDTRQALISWSFYRSKHKDNLQKVPNIAIAYPAADLASLAKWITPGSKTIWCAWSEKDLSTLDNAKKLVLRLKELGHKATLYPKDPSLTTKNKGP